MANLVRIVDPSAESNVAVVRPAPRLASLKGQRSL